MKERGRYSQIWPLKDVLAASAAQRAHNFRDITGQKFGQWSVLAFLGCPPKKNGKRVSYWLCECVCGVRKALYAPHLIHGNSKSCGCRRSKLPSGRAIRNAIRHGYEKDAIKRGLEWRLSDTEFDTLTQSCCFYCGNPPGRTRTAKESKGSFTYNGIDRVDNTQSYVASNVVACCKTCNRAKDTMSLPEFLAWVNRVATYSRLELGRVA